MAAHDKNEIYTGRYYSLLFIIFLGIVALIWRMVDLTVLDRDFLLRQGDARTLRIIKSPAYRGMITDRNGEPLAISTPVESVWINPQDFVVSNPAVNKFSKILKIPVSKIKKRLKHAADREFTYLKRGLDPETAAKVRALNIPGVYLQREFRRFYPEAEVTAHLLGFTNIDDHGQEGIELAYDKWLQGVSGKKRVIKDRMGHIVADVESIQEPSPGNNLVLSIDRRIQYLAHRVLKETVDKEKAKSGSVIVLDIKTGEVLAMANQPSFNPNIRHKAHDGRYRNRAVTDLFEPGSVMKAFSIATALKSGKYGVDTVVNTSPGWLVLDGKTIHDAHDYGKITVSQILQKSSNIGVTKMILSLDSEALWRLLGYVGFGSRTASGFPGESSGVLNNHAIWRPIVSATLAFGYGLSVTSLQLAHAYSVFGNDGKLLPVSLLRQNKPPASKRIFSKKIANEMLEMLAKTVEKGTGRRAKVKAYRVAGKTGTARIAGPDGYQENHHVASFVGLAPLSKPRIVVSVIINDPQSGRYYGGLIAAPVFSKVVGGALRILDVSPDNIT